MKIENIISFRYLFSRKSSNAIHWITGISILGISIGTASLILVLSIFNGFEELLSSFFSKHNPDVKIVLKEGKFFKDDSSTIARLQSLEGIKLISKTIEENALFIYQETQDFGTIMGVDSAYNVVCSFDEAIIEQSDLNCKEIKNCGLIGLGVRNKLGIDLSNPLDEIRIFIPTLNNGMEDRSMSSLRSLYIKASKVFNIHQEQDFEYIITDLDILRNYLQKENQLSSIEIKLKNANDDSVVQEIKKIMGNDFIVKDRAKQDESFIKIMKLEKWMFYALFSLTLIIVCFTLIGTLWMIVLEKKMDIAILKSLGMYDSDVKKIFIRLGLALSAIGILLGFVFSITFYFLQKKYGLIGVPEEFIIDSYPIKMLGLDFIIVAGTVLAIGFIASYLPSRKIDSIPSIFREE
ncbi:MAG TPA: FtsX-like permease family protein [Saprospiraceae bacterium]|nr:FtsX-like permease family protein [Saprospiraceae bacterium]